MHIVILGNGVAGIAAARRIRQQSNFPITIVADESDYFFSRTALMYVFMGQMRLKDLHPYPESFWPQNNIRLLRARVSSLDTTNKSLLLEDGRILAYDKLLLATGSSPAFPEHIPGIHLKGVQGLYHLNDLHTMELAVRNLQQAVVTIREMRRDIARLKTEVRRREIASMDASALAGRSKIRERRSKGK